MKQSMVQTEYLYVYGLTYLDEIEKEKLPDLTGIDHRPVYPLVHDNLVAIVTSVRAEDFSQEKIDTNLKNTEWLKSNAFHHHECIFDIHKQITILPLPFSTIFESEKNLRNYLDKQKSNFQKNLTSINGKEEWNLKLFCDQEKLLTFAVAHDPSIIDLKEKIRTMPKGRQFLFKKKLEQQIASQSESLQSQCWLDIHEQLRPLFSESHLRQNWSKEVTERKEEMIANCDFLIPRQNVSHFFTQVKELEEKLNESGCSFQISGPWPPYHFSKCKETT